MRLDVEQLKELNEERREAFGVGSTMTLLELIKKLDSAHFDLVGVEEYDSCELDAHLSDAIRYQISEYAKAIGVEGAAS